MMGNAVAVLTELPRAVDAISRVAANRIPAGGPSENYARALLGAPGAVTAEDVAHKLDAVLPQLGNDARELLLAFVEVYGRLAQSEIIAGERLRPASEHEIRDNLRALDQAALRGQRSAAAELAKPFMLSGEEFAKRLGTTRQTIDNWRNQKRVIGLSADRRGIRYPDFQIGSDGTLRPEIAEILAAAGNAWLAYYFLVEPQPAFGGSTGLELLGREPTDKLVAFVKNDGTGFL